MDKETARMTEQIGGSMTTSTCIYWLAGRCNRNPCKFLHTKIPLSFHQYNSNTTLIKKSEGDDTSVQNIVKEDNPRPIRLIWWTVPPQNFIKINCDGAFTSHGNKAAAGGVVRNWEGRFIFAFASALENCSIVEAELWAIKIGMEEAISRRFLNLIVENDSYSAIELVNRGVQKSHPYYALVSSIIEMRSKVHQICCNHVFRETNSVADSLAKYGLSLYPNLSVELFESPPSFIMIPMWRDNSGIIYSR